MPKDFDWRDKLRTFLVAGGTDGRSMKDIVYYMNHLATSPEITQHLEAWQVEQKVDSFRVPTKGRPSQWWRATTKMLSELPKYERDAKVVKTKDEPP